MLHSNKVNLPIRSTVQILFCLMVLAPLILSQKAAPVFSSRYQWDAGILSPVVALFLPFITF